MRRDVLSFLMASCVVLVLFIGNSVFQNRFQKEAVASPSPDVKFERYSASKIRALRNRVLLDSQALLDLKGLDIKQLMQEPELVRKDLPTIVWQYRTESCVLDLYFTHQTEMVSQSPVVHYEIRSRDTKTMPEIDAKSCLNSLAQPANFVSLWDTGVFYKSSQ